MKTTVAIVTTVRQPGLSLLSFLNYHLKIGFDHIYVFFDDQTDPMIKLAQSFKKVSVIKNDQSLTARWRSTRLFRDNSNVANYLGEEVMARQLLNVSVATEMALEDGIDWLLHIDHDELFYTSAVNVQDHFQTLSSKGIQSMCYLNHEAVPESLGIDNIFKEVTLFKKNRSIFSKKEELYFNSMANQDHFLYYWNGKSSGKVTDSLLPEHVHAFRNHQPENITADPCILHYPVCGLTNFIDKYKLLGYFNEKWFGIGEISKLIPFHIEARNLINSSEYNEIREFYCRRVMADEKIIAQHIENGIYFRIDRLIKEGLIT